MGLPKIKAFLRDDRVLVIDNRVQPRRKYYAEIVSDGRAFVELKSEVLEILSDLSVVIIPKKIIPKKTTAKYQPGEGPGVLQQATNFAKAASKHVLSGGKTVSQEVVEERAAICHDCPSNKFRVLEGEQIPKHLRTELVIIGKCVDLGCGCYIHTLETPEPSKLRWASSECPQGHWGKADG